MKRVLSLAILLMLAFSCVFTAFAQTDDTATPDEAKKVTELKITKLPDKLTYTAEDVIEPDIDLSKIADENEGKIKVCKVNVDEEPDLAEKFGVMSIPTFVAIKNGEVLGTSIGVQDEEELLKIFNK